MKVYSIETMKNLYEPKSTDEIRSRIALLSPASERAWGKMNPAQMLAHCALSMEWAVGDTVPQPGPFPIRMLGKLIKPIALGNDQPLRKNSPTAKELIIPDQRDLNGERTRLIALIDRFATAGPASCTTHPHSFFGRLTPQEWAVLTYKHLDHHLRQFGV